MGHTFWLLIAAAALVATAVGFVVGWICDKMEDDIPDLLVLLLAAVIAFVPLGAILFGYAPDGVVRIHGIIWTIAFFTGVHLSQRKRQPVT